MRKASVFRPSHKIEIALYNSTGALPKPKSTQKFFEEAKVIIVHLPELKRIGSNYSRLILSLFIGLLVARVLIQYGGVPAFAVYSFVTIGLGFGVMVREMLRISVIPEMGKLLDDEASLESYMVNLFFACTILSLIAGCTVFYLGYKLGEFVQLADELGSVGFLFLRTLTTAITVLLAPVYCLILATQQFILSNTVVLLEKVADFLAVLAVATAVLLFNYMSVLWVFGLVSAVFYVLFYWFVVKDVLRSNGIRLSGWCDVIKYISYSKVIGIFVNLKYPLLLVFSLNVFVRFDIAFAAEFFGVIVVAALGLSLQLTGLLRQFCTGIANGLDAVVSRSAQKRGHGESEEVIARNVKIQFLVVGHLTVFLILFSEVIYRVWLGEKVSVEVVRIASSLTTFVLLGLCARGIAECWMAYLNGRGFSGAYVWGLFWAASVNIVMLVVFSNILSKDNLLVLMVVAFALIHILVYLFYIPYKYSVVSGVSVKSVFVSILQGLMLPLTSGAFVLFFFHEVGIFFQIVCLAVFGALDLLRVFFLLLSDNNSPP